MDLKIKRKELREAHFPTIGLIVISVLACVGILFVAQIVNSFYIFNDGRVNTKKNKLEPINNKSINLRINKTKELEDFVKNNLQIEIVKKY